MRILVSNDDGYQSPGIKILSRSLRDLGHDVWVIAPQRDRSTVGHSLTLHKPLRMISYGEQEFYVSGSPADCVYMGTRHVLKDKKPDLVVSGINQGANLGNDIFYSGTVAAAREGLLFGIPSVAISLCFGMPKRSGKVNHNTVSEGFIKKYFEPLLERGVFSTKYLTNVCLPDIEADLVKGLRVSRQGRRFYKDVVREDEDPRHKKYYWVGGAYEGFDEIEESDCVAVNEGYISVSPLNLDTTNYEAMKEIKGVEDISWS